MLDNTNSSHGMKHIILMHHAEKKTRKMPSILHCIRCGACVCVFGFSEISLTFHSSSNRFFFHLLGAFYQNRSYAILTVHFVPHSFLALALAHLHLHVFLDSYSFNFPNNFLSLQNDLWAMHSGHLLWLWSTVSNSVSFNGIFPFMLVRVCGTEPLFRINLSHLRRTGDPGETFRFVKMFPVKDTRKKAIRKMFQGPKRRLNTMHLPPWE